MSRALLVLLGGLVLAGCQGCHPQPGPNPPPGPLPTLDGPIEASCAAICARGRALSCDWAADTAQGHHCEEVCATATSGGPVSWDLRCRAGAIAKGCFAVDTCP